MEKPKSSVGRYVESWIGRLNDRGVSSSTRLGIAHDFSCDIQSRIVANMFTDSEVYRELRSHLGETPARNLIRLHALPQALIRRAENHIASGKIGGAYSQFNYAMKLPKELQVAMLNTSMVEELSCRAFQKRVDAVMLGKSKRPTCVAKQVHRVARRLERLLAEVNDDGFIDSLAKSDPVRRVAAIANLHSADYHLERIAARVIGSDVGSVR
jgi:hypothetical protein